MASLIPDFGAEMRAIAGVLQSDPSTSAFGFTTGWSPDNFDAETPGSYPVGWVTRAGVDTEGTVGEPHEDGTLALQVNCSGLTEQQAESLLHLARLIVLDLPSQPSPIAGRRIFMVEVAGGTTIPAGDPLPGRYVAIEIYSIHTTPA